MAGNSAVVDAFVQAWNNKDLDAVLACMTDDVVYHNIPMEPINGVGAVRQMMTPFLATIQQIEWIILAQAENASGAVLNERIDKFLINGKWIALPVMGSFEFRDGKISAWRDYFDLAQFNAAMASTQG
ncbi:limonene-1,2-epoxide hydrolase family protein [Zavarzinia sp. CC-PAN008]|uniref:limonene-1,2-epoxide hydrolase family protein n=1 Tax=Zavarzinia sp. CC-PAN008 TaxID=3243332 RepID=UPI003F74702C